MRSPRIHGAGPCYFFTVVTYDRRPILIAEVERLRGAFRTVLTRHPFTLEAIVVLPDHLHTMWRMQEGDGDFSMRWRVLKRLFSSGLSAPGQGASRARKRENAVWQRRFWDHAIRDDDDWRRHLDYIHYNPVRHGYCSAPGEWAYSSFARMVERGWYEPDWGRNEPPTASEAPFGTGIEGQVEQPTMPKPRVK
jgi:putative transposase